MEKKSLKSGKPTFTEKNTISPEPKGQSKSMMDKSLFSADKMTGAMNAAPAAAKKQTDMVNESVGKSKPNEMWPCN